MNVVLAVISLLSAGAAVSSALIARAALQRTNVPVVWANVRIARDGDLRRIEVRFHNGGSGFATNVGAAKAEPGTPEPGSDEVPWSTDLGSRTPPIPVLRPGESNPEEEEGHWFSVGGLPVGGDDIAAISIRYTDGGRRRWETYAQLDPLGLLPEPTPFRRSFWELWVPRPDLDW